MATGLASWSPAMPGHENFARALEELMWVMSVDYDHFGTSLQIRGYVKVMDGPVDTEGQILRGLMDTLEEILDLCDQADLELYGFPDIEVSHEQYGGPQMMLTLKIVDC